MMSRRIFSRGILAALALCTALVSGNACAASQNARRAPAAPVALIEAPRDGATFIPGDTLLLAAAEPGTPAPAALRYEWKVELLDGERALATYQEHGARAHLVPGSDGVGEGAALRVRLVVLDAHGRRDSATVRVYAGPLPGVAGTIGPGDVLQIAIYAGGDKQEDFTGEVSSAGMIAMPLLGEVHAAGSSTSQFSGTLKKMLGESYYVNPQVLVTIKGQPDQVRRKVFVLGEVAKPGAYPLEDGLTVMQACTLAGGFTNFASLGTVRVTRTTGGTRQSFTVDLVKVRNGKKEDVLLRSGDQIDVPHRRF